MDTPPSEPLRNLEEKLEQLDLCMQSNRTYKKKLLVYKDEVRSKLREIEDMLSYHKEKKKISMLTKFNDSSPHINFYSYDTICQPRPRIMYLMRMLDKSIKISSKDNMVMDKLINMSTSSEYSSSDDFEDFG